MINSLRIENFRCFKDLALEDLARINIITGDNAAGKSTILEAIFIACNPHLQAIRMLNGSRIPPLPILQKDNFFSLVERYFNDPYSRIVFEVDKKNSDSSEKWKVEMIILRRLSEFSTPSSIPPFQEPCLEFKITENNKPEKKPEKILIGFNYNNLFQWHGPSKEILPNKSFFINSIQNLSESANILSSLIEKKEESVLLDAFKKEYPEIKDILILVRPDFPNGAVFFKIKDPDIIIPSTLYSSGTHKSFTILLAAADPRLKQQGIILVDEIENGIHWSRMQSFWRLLDDVTTKTQIQVFATTHSYECLESFVDIMKKPVEFTIIHAKKDPKTNEFSASVIPGEFAESAIKSRLEIR